ncbi:uncharacterized protein [Prorops nasuta]|uniref:uncharacterized protein isoform X2 n=1 Tax=Prorops nasuta TaxID=863751 RepID=UPI0034CF60DE
MNYSRNMPNWHQYNSSQSSITEAASNAQNVNSNHYAYVSNINRPSLGSHEQNSEGVDKHQNITNYNARHYQSLANISNSPNGTDSNLLSSMVQVSRCMGHNISPIARSVGHNLNGSVDPRTGPINILNEELGYRNNQISISTTVPHLSGPNLNVNNPPSSATTGNIQGNTLPNTRQAIQPAFLSCKGSCCVPENNINYQHWEKYGQYQSNIPYRNNIHTGYQAENRRYFGEVNFRKENYDNKDVLGAAPPNVDHRRNYSEYKQLKESMTTGNYPSSSGILSNYSTQNYNLPSEYHKYPYSFKDYPKMGGMGMQSTEVLKHQEQNFITQQKYNNKPVHYQSEATLPKGLPHNNMDSNIMSSSQNSYYNLQYPGNLHMEYLREIQDPPDASLMNKEPPPPVQHSSRYQFYQQKIAMQRHFMENHLREYARVPGYQTQQKYKEGILRYKEILKLQQPNNHQNNLQLNSIVTTPVGTSIPPINLQFDQNGTLINSNYLPDYSKLQVISSEITPESLTKNQNKYSINIAHSDQMIGQSQNEKSPSCEKIIHNPENLTVQQDAQDQNKNQNTNTNENIRNETKTSKEFTNKPELDVRQFLANWDESEEEDTSNLPDVVLSNSTPVVIVGYENIDLSVKDLPDIQDTEQTSISLNKVTSKRQDKGKINVLTSQDYSNMQYTPADSSKPLEQITTENIVKSGSIMQCLSNSSDEIPTIHIIDSLKIGNVIKTTGNVTAQEETTFFKERESSAQPISQSKDSLNKVNEAATKSPLFESAIENETEQKSDQESVETFRKQSSLTSEESHNPDDISLPDLPTSECTPISTTLNTPIHSDSEESSEQVEGLKTSTNPIEVIQNSPMISFTHSPVKMEPYMVEHLNNQNKIKDKKHGALEFDFQEEISSGPKSESSNVGKSNKCYKMKSGKSNRKKHCKLSEKEQKDALMLRKRKSKKITSKYHGTSSNKELLAATENIALQNAEASLRNELYSSIELSQNIDITHNIIPLIPDEGNEEPKLPVPPMEDNCLTKFIKTTMPITNLSVSNPCDEEKVDKDDDPWLQMKCGDKVFAVMSNSDSPNNTVQEKVDINSEDKHDDSYKEREGLNVSDVCSAHMFDSLNSSDIPHEKYSTVKCKPSKLSSKGNLQKEKDDQNVYKTALLVGDKQQISPIVNPSSSITFEKSVQSKEHFPTKSFVTKSNNSNFEIKLANVGIKIKDNDTGKDLLSLEEHEKNDSNNTLDAIKIEINVSRSDRIQHKRRSSIMKINDEIVQQLALNSDDDSESPSALKHITLFQKDNEYKEPSERSNSCKKMDDSTIGEKLIKRTDNETKFVTMGKPNSDKELVISKSIFEDILSEPSTSKEIPKISQFTVVQETENISDKGNNEKEVRKEKSNVNFEMRSSLMNLSNTLKLMRFNHNIKMGDNTIENPVKDTKDYGSLINHYGLSLIESQPENGKEPLDTSSIMEPLSKRINLRRNEAKDAMPLEAVETTRNSCSSYSKLDVRFLSTSKTTSSNHKNFSNKIPDFDYFEVDGKIFSDYPSKKSSDPNLNSIIDNSNSNLLKSSNGFANPIFSSVDKLEDLNTVPVYTTKDGKITYSPNPRFTYRELLLEASDQCECQLAFEDVLLTDRGCNNNQRANKFYKKKHNFYSRRQNFTNYDEPKAPCKFSARQFDKQHENTELNCKKKHNYHWKDREYHNDNDSKKISYNTTSLLDKVEPIFSSNLKGNKSKLLYDVKGHTNKIDNLGYRDEEAETILFDAGLFLENKTSYREDTREATYLSRNRIIMDKNFNPEKKDWSFRDAFPTPSSTVSSQFSFKEKLSDSYLISFEQSAVDRLSICSDNTSMKKDCESFSNDIFELNEFSNSMNIIDASTKSPLDEKRTSGSVMPKSPILGNEMVNEQKDFLQLDEAPTIEKISCSMEENDPVEEMEYSFRAESVSPPKLSAELDLEGFAQMDTGKTSQHLSKDNKSLTEHHRKDNSPDDVSTKKELMYEVNTAFVQSSFNQMFENAENDKCSNVLQDSKVSLNVQANVQLEHYTYEPNAIPSDLNSSSDCFSTNFSEYHLDDKSQGEVGVLALSQEAPSVDESDKMDNTDKMPVLLAENVEPYSQIIHKSDGSGPSRSCSLPKLEKFKFQKRIEDEEHRASNNPRSECSNYEKVGSKSCNINFKSVPKLVIKKSDTNPKIVSKLFSSKNFEVDDSAESRKVPKMIIRNARSRPGTPTIEEVPKNAHYVKYSKVEEDAFQGHSQEETKEKTNEEVDSDSDRSTQGKTTLPMEITSDDSPIFKVKSKLKEFRKEKKKKSEKPESSLENKRDENRKHVSRCSKYSHASSYEKYLTESVRKRNKSLKLKLRKQISDRSTSPEMSKRKYFETLDCTSKKSKKVGKEEDHQIKYLSETKYSMDSAEEKIPKVIIKRSSANAEFKCEISKDAKGIVDKSIKWQPEVKLERSPALDRIVKELKESKHSLSLSALKDLNILFTKAVDKTFDRQKKLFRSNSTSDLSPNKIKHRRLSDFYYNSKLYSDANKNETHIITVNDNKTNIDGAKQGESPFIERNYDDLKDVSLYPSLQKSIILSNTENSEEFSTKCNLDAEIKKEDEDNNNLFMEQPLSSAFNPCFIKEESVVIETDNEYSTEKTSITPSFPDLEEDKFVIKVDSSDESQTTIEILPASPLATDQNVLSPRLCSFENIEYGQLYSEDAIPTQFELELEITDNSNIDPLEVPIPTHVDVNHHNKDEVQDFNAFTKHLRKNRYSLDSAIDSSEKNKVSSQSLLKDNINNNKRIHQRATGSSDNICCNDHLMKEVLAAKDALKKCLSRSSNESSSKTKGRLKTAAEKKQGSCFSTGSLSSFGEPYTINAGIEQNSTEKNQREDKVDSGSSIRKSEKRHSKSNITSNVKKKIKLKHHSRDEDYSCSVDDIRIKSPTCNFTPVSLTSKQYSAKNTTLKGKVPDNLLKENDCVMKGSIENESINSKKSNVMSDQEQGNTYLFNETSTLLSSDERKRKKRNTTKATEDMPILEPEIADFDPCLDRDCSRSPPVITNQICIEKNTDRESAKEKDVNLREKNKILDSHCMDESELTIADIIAQLAFHEKATIRSRRYCTLCERWFPTAARHRRHLTGYQHRHTELVQRRTVHALFMLFTGRPCPRLLPANVARTDCSPGELTPLQIAVQDVTACIDNVQKNLNETTDIKK